MPAESPEVKRVLRAIDALRGLLLGLAIGAVIAFAAFRAGGVAGWLLGAVLLVAGCLLGVAGLWIGTPNERQRRRALLKATRAQLVGLVLTTALFFIIRSLHLQPVIEVIALVVVLAAMAGLAGSALERAEKANAEYRKN